jgi:hypothetical protein
MAVTIHRITNDNQSKKIESTQATLMVANALNLFFYFTKGFPENREAKNLARFRELINITS